MTKFVSLRLYRNCTALTLLLAVAAVGASTLASSSARAEDAAPVDFDLEQYRGSVVVVDFWASWCVPCRRSFPWLNTMQDRYADDGLIVIGINVDKSAADAKAFLTEHPAQFRIVSDPNGTLAKRFDVIAMPSSFVIGRDGKIAETHLGFKVRKQDDYEAALVRTLGIL